MSEPEAVTERTSWSFPTSQVIDGGDQTQYIAGATVPIHFAGMSLCINNNSATRLATFQVDDSPDGTTWTPVLFSTSALSGQLTIAIVPLGQVHILFESEERFIRLSVSPRIEDHVHVVGHQFPPRGRAAIEEY